MQSKFLEGVDSHTPEKDVDAITQAKRQVQRILMKAGYKCDAKAFDDNCILHLDDGTEIKFEIVDVKKPEVEDQEGIITQNQKDALEIAGSLTQDPKKRLIGRDPKKAIDKALGDMYNKVAKKVTAISKTIK